MPRRNWILGIAAFALVGCARVPTRMPSLAINPSPAVESALTGPSDSDQSDWPSRSSDVEPVHFTQLESAITSMSDEPSWANTDEFVSPVPGSSSRPRVDLNLPSALAVVGGSHPIVGLARWRTQEAYAELDAAKALWLPSIQAGFSVHRHDGNYQASNGDIVDVNRNSLQYGLGMGATGAGTTQRPGLVAQFHLADAIFQPNVARKTAWARGHAAGATLNQQLRDVAVAYTRLVQAAQEAAILESSNATFMELDTLVNDFAEAGEGLQSDVDRVRTERLLNENRVVAARQSISVASARLTQALSYDSSVEIMPLDVNVVALDLQPPSTDVVSLIQTGLSARPELKESQALVAAACEAYRRQKYAPMVPSVLLGFSTGGFGGGLGGDLDDVSGRYDFDAMLSWEIRQLGLGEKAARRAASARVQQARFEAVARMDQVAREITEAAARIEQTRQQMTITQQAIEIAQRSYERNRDRIGDGEGLPIEVLQSVQALEASRLAYLQAVIDQNIAQFELQWAMGYPVS